MENQEPISLFKEWMDDARRAGVADPTAMSLATVDAQGRPTVRMVLLKAIDEHGFVFYTNLESPKVADLKAHPHAALCFHWPASERQVRIDGPVEAVTDAEADAYFATRPRLSQLGAWASKQSQPMACAGLDDFPACSTFEYLARPSRACCSLAPALCSN